MTSVAKISDRNKLADIGLLSKLEGDVLRRVETQCCYHEFAAKQTILNCVDEDGHDVFFILEGTVRIVNHSRNGREITFANIYTGGYFGELAALTDEAPYVNVIAATDCRLASLSGELFGGLILANPNLSIQLIDGLGKVVRQRDRRIMDLSTRSAVQRVHSEILRQARRDSSNGWVINPWPRHEEIASLASTTRETVARALTVLCAAGIASREGRRLDILDHDRLHQWVEDGRPQVPALRNAASLHQKSISTNGKAVVRNKLSNRQLSGA